MKEIELLVDNAYG